MVRVPGEAAVLKYPANQEILVVQWNIPTRMSEKSNKNTPLIIAVVLNASFTLLLIIFVAHQQVEIASLRQMVQENNQNKAEKLEATLSDGNQERIKPELTLPQVLSWSKCRIFIIYSLLSPAFEQKLMSCIYRRTAQMPQKQIVLKMKK